MRTEYKSFNNRSTKDESIR